MIKIMFGVVLGDLAFFFFFFFFFLGGGGGDLGCF